MIRLGSDKNSGEMTSTCHFFSSTKLMKLSLSLAPRYCRNTPSWDCLRYSTSETGTSWPISFKYFQHLDVENGGEGGDHEPARQARACSDVNLTHTHLLVQSVEFPVLIWNWKQVPTSKTSLQPANSSQVGCSARQAGHQGAALREINQKHNEENLGANDMDQATARRVVRGRKLTTRPSILLLEAASTRPLGSRSSPPWPSPPGSWPSTAPATSSSTTGVSASGNCPARLSRPALPLVDSRSACLLSALQLVDTVLEGPCWLKHRSSRVEVAWRR